MNDEPRATADYQRTKTSALQQLAAAGDRAALRELQRRGIEASTLVDVTMLDAGALVRLVHAWRDGVTQDERGHNRTLAERAHAELEVRYRVDLKLHQAGQPVPQPPLTPPWLWPRPKRCENWRRPAGSKLYPSEADRARAQFAALARAAYHERNQQ